MALFFVVAIALVPVVLLVPLLVWTRWLRRLAAAPTFVARSSYVLLALAALATLLGVVGSVRAVTSTLPVEPGGPSQKARLLAQGISEAMNCGALAILVAVVAALWLLFAAWRWNWAARESK